MNIDKLQLWFTLERTNAAYYDAMSASLDAVNWAGCSEWMKQAADDERTHAQRLDDYIVSVNGVPEFAALEEIPELTGDDLPQYFMAAMAREKETTAFITGFASECISDGDMQTLAMILNPGEDWPGFVAEQTKSERDLTDILLELSRLDKTGWKLVDQDLGKK